MVKGKATTVLTNMQGETLYYFTPDTPTTSNCTGGCAGTWPPLLLASGTPTSASPLPGKLTVVMDANGNQVQYNGHFLYAFSGDSAPGQANGQGIGGVWFVATPSLS
jgi:predicted lipoprotein with Yx(FWY)xxD motif